MSTTTVRVSVDTHQRLAALAAARGQPMHVIIEDAVAAYEANSFWEAFTAGYDQLADDPQRWSDLQDERTGEAPALADDLGTA